MIYYPRRSFPMKTIVLIAVLIFGVAATKKLQSPKAAGDEPVILRPVVTMPVPLPKAMAKSNTNQHPGWVGLSWTYSPSPEAAGYRIHQGTNSRAYNVQHDVGLGTNITQWPQCLCPTNGPQTTGCAKIFNLVVGQKYFFTVTAYSTNGTESDFSNEVDFTFKYKTNVTVLVSALIGPSWITYTNLPPIVDPTGASFFRLLSVNGTAAIQSAKSPFGIYTNRLTFPTTNTLWKLSITRSNW